MLLREVYRHLRRRAREHGLPDVRGGAVAIVPRVGGALNLNVHLHALVLDGVFARGDNGRLRCHAAPARNAADVADVLAASAPGVQHLLARPGGPSGDPRGADAFAEASPRRVALAAASIPGQTSVDPGGSAPGTCHARRRPSWNAWPCLCRG